MSCYISSNDNRFYVGPEANYAEVPSISFQNRFPAVKLTARQLSEVPQRRDKTGGRSYLGVPTGARRTTNFELRTYLTSWTNQTEQPGYGPLFQAAMGKEPLFFTGGTVQSITSATRLRLSGAHQLRTGQGVSVDGEIRFVSTIVDDYTIEVNAPFTNYVEGAPVGPTITYPLGSELKSVSIFDYWSPTEAVHRILCGAGVNTMSIGVNGDYHEFDFSGPARDLLDSTSFSEGDGSLSEFPPEPDPSAYEYSVIPGHLGQAWLGNAPDRFFTLTGAAVKLDNGIDVRNREFGSAGPRCLVPGQRSVSLDFSLYQQDDSGTFALYQAARQRSPITVMLQLGQRSGQLLGMYVKSVVPEVPEFDDADSRLQWKFANCRAQGDSDDELAIAFG